MNNNDKELHNPTLRVIRIINLLGEEPQGLTLTELSEKMEASKSTITPIMKTLVSQGFASVKDYKYTLGLSLYRQILSKNEPFIKKTIRDEMERISDITRETSQLGVLKGPYILYMEKVDGNQEIQLVSFVGQTLPAYATALGKCILTTQTPEEIAALFAAGFKKYTPNTITDLESLMNELEKVKKAGIAYDLQERKEGITCIAVPLTSNGSIIAALSVSAPSFRLTSEKEEIIIRELKASQHKLDEFLSANGVNHI